MPGTTPFRFPRAYRLLFIVLDIVLPLMGMIINTFAPLNALQNFVPYPKTPISPETYVLLSCTSGFFATLAFINIYLLVYRPNDLIVWKGLVAGVLLQDLFMIGGFLTEIRSRNVGGAFVTDWKGQDLGNVIGYAVITLLRGSFIALVGSGTDNIKKES